MQSIQIGRKKNSGLSNPNAHPLSFCRVLELERVYGEETDGENLSLSFSWITEDPESGAIETGNYLLPLSESKIGKPIMGIFFLRNGNKPIVISFENVKEAITVECIGKMVPYDFTLKYKVLK